jgi:aryl-alcohol dehydrogenase-like predicted oxidoreductase
MSLSGTYGTSDDAAAIPFLERAIDLGVDFLDSSDAYGLGQNEELLGRALKGRRDKVVLATKFGQDRRSGGVNGRPEYVQQACEASLKRLGVEVIDLYSKHRVDPGVPGHGRCDEPAGQRASALSRIVRGRAGASAMPHDAPRCRRILLLYREVANSLAATAISASRLSPTRSGAAC